MDGQDTYSIFRAIADSWVLLAMFLFLSLATSTERLAQRGQGRAADLCLGVALGQLDQARDRLRLVAGGLHLNRTDVQALAAQLKGERAVTEQLDRGHVGRID